MPFAKFVSDNVVAFPFSPHLTLRRASIIPWQLQGPLQKRLGQFIFILLIMYLFN